MESVDKQTEWVESRNGVVKTPLLNSIGFVWVLVTAIAANLFFGGVNHVALGVISLIVGVGVLIWTAESLFAKQFRFSKNSLQIPFIGLIVVGLIQLLPIAGSDVSKELLSIPAVSTISIDPFVTRLAVVKLTLFLIFLAAAFHYLDTPRRLKVTVFVIIVFGAVMSFFGILQKLSTPDIVLWIKQVDYAKPFATYINQHHFAAFLEMTIALALGLLFAGSTKPDKRLLLVIAVVLMGLGIVFTSSRGAMISLVGVLGMLTFLSFWSGLKTDSKKGRKTFVSRIWVLVGANILLIAVLILSVSWIGGADLALRSAGMEGGKDFSNGRWEFWTNTLPIIKENPVLGTGIDTFDIAYTKYDPWNGAIRVNQAHNDYLQTLSDSGILGFICIAAFVFLLFRKSFKTIGGARHPYRRGIAAGALAGCFGIMIHSFFDFPLRTNANMFFFLICAVLATVPVDFPLAVRKKVKNKRENG